jgi:hypothetical protein
LEYTKKVRDWLKEGIESGDVPKGAAGKQCQQFCKFLKEAHKDQAYSLCKEQILSAHASWNPPIPSEQTKKPKPKPKVKPESDSEQETQSKPRKPMSEATKAAAAAKRRATLAAKKAAEETDSNTIANAAAPASPEPPTREINWRKITLKKDKYLWDPTSNALFTRNEDDSMGTWAGVFDAAKKTINKSVKEFDPATWKE